jgi:hypothetical protein
MAVMGKTGQTYIQKWSSIKGENISDFQSHSCYLLNNYYNHDASQKRFVVVFSTENLLLNAYRQLLSTGHVSMVLAVDTSYQYTAEKLVLCPQSILHKNQRQLPMQSVWMKTMMHTSIYLELWRWKWKES